MWHKIDYKTKNAISCCQWKPTTRNIKHKTAYELEVSAQDTSQDSAFYTPWDDKYAKVHTNPTCCKIATLTTRNVSTDDV